MCLTDSLTDCLIPCIIRSMVQCYACIHTYFILHFAAASSSGMKVIMTKANFVEVIIQLIAEFCPDVSH